MHDNSALIRTVFRKWRGATFCLCIACAGATWAQDRLIVDPTGKSLGGLDDGIRFGPVHPNVTLAPTCFRPKVSAVVASVVLRPPLPPAEVGISSNQRCFDNQYGLDFYTAGLPRLSLDSQGHIGIGTISPTRAVDVQGAGDVEVSIRSTDPNGKYWTLQSTGAPQPDAPVAGTFQIIDRSANVKRLWIDPDGTVNVGVLRINGGADIAEPFRGIAGLPPGSVVVINEKSPGGLTLSDRAYDRRVAGIVSGANGIATGLALRASDVRDEQNVALTGRVYALADATAGPIRVGDLLTTSGTPGKVMRVKDMKRAQGAIIGKAMTPLDRGTGYVLVLVTLQ